MTDEERHEELLKTLRIIAITMERLTEATVISHAELKAAIARLTDLLESQTGGRPN